MKWGITDVAIILGKRGSGKTTLIRSLINQLARSYHIIALDILNNFTKTKNEEVININPDDKEQINNTLTKIWNRGNCIVVIDEYDVLSNTGASTKDILYKLLNLGRNRNIGLIVSARRTANISKNTLANCNKLFIGKTSYLKDIQNLEQYFTFSIESYQNLPDFHFLYLEDGDVKALVKG